MSNPSGRVSANLQSENFTPARVVGVDGEVNHALIKHFKIEGISFESGDVIFSGFQNSQEPEIKNGIVSYYINEESIDKVYLPFEHGIYFLVTPIYQD